jgi:nucleotide-binding universal stress UspA family protein
MHPPLAALESDLQAQARKPMITFRRILVPVDFSKQDHEAVSFVKAMAERFQSEVILLHVAEFVPAWYGATEPGATDPVVDLQSLMNERKQHL